LVFWVSKVWWLRLIWYIQKYIRPIHNSGYSYINLLGEILIMKLTQLQKSKSHRVLLFGAPKSGKTQLAGELSKEFNLLWFDLENGVDTLLKLPVEQQERVEVIQLPDTRSFPIAIETMLKVIKGSAYDICSEHGKVGCGLCKKESAPFTHVELSTLPLDTIVVVDSLTQLTNSAIAHITKSQPDDYKLTYDDWGNLGKLMDTFLSHVQQAPFNIVCISHETEVEMEDGRQKLVPTSGTRNFSRNTAKYFDEVVYCEVKNKKHIAASSTTYNGNILTGSRTGSVLETQAEASLAPIFKGEITVTNPATTGTPAQKAVTNLSSRLASLKKS
jgi:AAA domain